MRTLTSIFIILISSSVTRGDHFDMIDANGVASGSVELGNGRLVVFQSAGQRTYFGREPRYDSPDRQYVGYFNLELNRVVRFPRSGAGYLQTADLDDVAPRFRNSRYAVRPSAGQPGLIDPLITRGYRGGPYGGYRSRLPQSVLIDSQTIPNPPLPPARVMFGNDGPREVQVGVIDLQNPSGTRSTCLFAMDMETISVVKLA